MGIKARSMIAFPDFLTTCDFSSATANRIRNQKLMVKPGPRETHSEKGGGAHVPCLYCEADGPLGIFHAELYVQFSAVIFFVLFLVVELLSLACGLCQKVSSLMSPLINSLTA